MRLVIVSKSAFTHTLGEHVVPAVVSGHTAQLARALLTTAAADGHEVTHVYPATPAPGDALIVDPADRYPDGVCRVPFWDVSLPKSSLRSGALSFTAALVEADSRPIDWIVLLYAFPLAPLVRQFCVSTDSRFAALLRGGDAYKWLDPAWWARVHPESNSEVMASVYAASLQDADYVAAASRWLADVAGSFGVSCNDVLESPAAVWPGSPPELTDILSDGGAEVVAGRLDLGSKWLLWAGRASEDKQPRLALNAFEAAAPPNWTLVMAAVGDGEGDIARLIDRQGSNAALVRVSPRLMPALYSRCDALLHTAVPGDGFIDARPASVTSAAHAGKAVIAPLAERGGVLESLSPINQEELLFEVLGSDEIVHDTLVRTLRHLGDDELLTRIGNANRAWTTGSSPDAVWRRLRRGLEEIDLLRNGVWS